MALTITPDMQEVGAGDACVHPTQSRHEMMPASVINVIQCN